MSKRLTASRVPDSGIEVLFGTEERWQAWLAIESTLALTPADLEMIPREVADAITAACRIERLDLDAYGKEWPRPVIHISPPDFDGYFAWPRRLARVLRLG